MASLSNLFTAIADAIRAKDQTTTPITAATFPDRIRNIPSQKFMSTDDASWITRAISSAWTDSSMTYIGPYAFAGTSITSISFPECSVINAGAFYNIQTLTNISFPNCSLIQENAFYSCKSLTSISFLNCQTIEASAFYSCIN